MLASLTVASLPVPAAVGSSTSPVPGPPSMGDYPVSDFRDAAAELDPSLVQALHRDLDISPEEYLAQAAAAADASHLVEYLSEQGIDASDRRIDGTTLTIGVDTRAQAAIVEEAGATAVVGELPPPEVPGDDVIFESTAEIYGGDVISWTDGSGAGYRCSVGVNGTDSTGESQLVTAGHCSSATIGNSGLYRHVVISTPGFSPSGPFANVGPQRALSFQAGGGYDIGLVRVTQSGMNPQPYVTTFNGGQGDRATGLLPVRDSIIPTTGSSVCKSGATTGWTCGTITNAKVLNQQVSDYLVDVFVTNVCMLGGDSGGPALVGNAFVGVNSGSAFGSPPQGYTGTPVEFCEGASNKRSVMAIARHEQGVRTIETRYGSTWEPTVLVDTPSVSIPSTFMPGASLTVTGGLTSPTPRTRIEVSINGSARAVSFDTTSGAWSANLGTVTGSSARVVVQAVWGQRSRSLTVVRDLVASGTAPSAPPVVERIAGADRYDVAIGIAQRAYPGPGRPTTVYVVNGGDYPDALSAGSAASATGGVVMLVPSTELPSKITAELQRLSPQRIVIVGGPASVSEGVRAAIASAVPGAALSRISGADRFEVSRRVLSETPQFDAASNIYVANGFNYPDALVAGAAGSSASRLSPVLIVPGPEASLPASTVTAIENEGFSTIKIAGGPGSVTESIRAQLSTVPAAVTTRLGGADRFEAARSVANDAYPGLASTVFLTTGLNFPDALAGAPLAGLLDAPMYSVQTSCVPRSVLSDLDRLKPTRIILLGGTGTLTPAVAALTPCP